MVDISITCKGFETTKAIEISVSDCANSINKKTPISFFEVRITKEIDGEFNLYAACKTELSHEYSAKLSGSEVYKMIRVAGQKLSRQATTDKGKMVSKRGCAVVMP